MPQKGHFCPKSDSRAPLGSPASKVTKRDSILLSTRQRGRPAGFFLHGTTRSNGDLIALYVPGGRYVGAPKGSVANAVKAAVSGLIGFVPNPLLTRVQVLAPSAEKNSKTPFTRLPD